MPHPAFTTIDELFRARLEEAPDRIAYRYLAPDDDVIEVTRAALAARVAAVSATITEAVAPGARVFLVFPPGLEFVEALFACHRAGVVAIPVQAPLGRRDLARVDLLAAHAHPELVLTNGATRARLDRRMEGCKTLRRLRWRTTENAVGTAAPRRPSPVALVQFTSGSTGHPKGVVLTHDNLLSNARQMHEAFGAPRYETDGTVCWLPTFHDMGLMSGVLGPLYSGIVGTLLSHLSFAQRPARWLEAVARHRATISGGPNFAYALCARATPAEGLDLSTWRVAFCGAEPVRAETMAAFAETYAPTGFRRGALHPCYGLAEATLGVTSVTGDSGASTLTVSAGALARHRVVPADSGRTLVSCGRPVEGVRVAIVEPATARPLGEGEVGEIWVRGPNVAAGYLDDDGASAATFDAVLDGETGFLRTGDLGFSWERELFVTGRAKDLIIVRGVNHHPEDIETSASTAHASFVAGGCAAFGIDHGDEEALVVVQEVRRTARSELGGACDALRNAVALDHGVGPREILLVLEGRIPRTSSGKVRRATTRDDFLADTIETLDRWRDEG